MLFEQQAVAPIAGPVTKANIVVISLAGLGDDDVAQLRLPGANQLKCRFTYPAAGGTSATTESNATLVSATAAQCLLSQQPAGTASDDGALSLGVGANFAAPLTSAPTMRTG